MLCTEGTTVKTDSNDKRTRSHLLVPFAFRTHQSSAKVLCKESSAFQILSNNDNDHSDSVLLSTSPIDHFNPVPGCCAKSAQPSTNSRMKTFSQSHFGVWRLLLLTPILTQGVVQRKCGSRHTSSHRGRSIHRRSHGLPQGTNRWAGSTDNKSGMLRSWAGVLLPLLCFGVPRAKIGCFAPGQVLLPCQGPSLVLWSNDNQDWVFTSLLGRCSHLSLVPLGLCGYVLPGCNKDSSALSWGEL